MSTVLCPAGNRLPCHRHEPNTDYAPDAVQHTALRHARCNTVRVLIAPCGPDSAMGGSVFYSSVLPWDDTELAGWSAIKELYLNGVVMLEQPDPRYPYDYIVLLNPAHPINQPATS